MGMKPHHYAWLSEHPERSEDWLRDRLKDGFDIHHLDGNHSNNDPKNLILVDAADHMMLHNGSKRMRRMSSRSRVTEDADYRKKMLLNVGAVAVDERDSFRTSWAEIARLTGKSPATCRRWYTEFKRERRTVN